MKNNRELAVKRLGISNVICMISFIALEAQMGGSTTGMVFPEPGVLLTLAGLGVSGICILVFGFQAWLN
jgi:hypothetical protein